MPITDVEQATIMQRLCELTKECPCTDGPPCQSCKEYSIRDNAAHREGFGCEGSLCLTCEGTGRVPLLSPALVRVECIIGEHHDGFGEAWHGHYPDVHQDKDCPGWKPNPNPWAYVQAVWHIDSIRIRLRQTMKRIVWEDEWHGQDLGLACLAVVAEALL